MTTPATGATTPGVLSILAVCSHNQVRSVMVQLLLQRALDQAEVPAVVCSAGFADGGRPALPGTVSALRSAHLDATGHHSTRVDAAMVRHADLVLTAERVHVVRLVEDRSELLAKVFTLPEFAGLAEAAGPRAALPFTEWLALVGAGRTHASFLDQPTPEIADPTGHAQAGFDATAACIDEWARAIAAVL